MFGAGGGLAAIALLIGTRAASLVLIALGSASLLTGAALVYRLPHLPAVPRPQETRRGGVWRDRPFLAFAGIAALGQTFITIIDVVLPLWVVQRTDAPDWVVAMLLFVANCGLVWLLQARAARGVNSPGTAGPVMRKGGLALLASCAAFATTGALSGWVAVAVLLAGMVLLTFGEVWQMAGEIAGGFSLAAEHAQGEYQGVLGGAIGLAQALAPAFMIPLTQSGGWGGWLVIGALFVAAGVAAPPITRWVSATVSS